MDRQVQENLDRIGQIAAGDQTYRQMLLDMRSIEQKYNTMLASLSRDEQNAICDFVSQCEEMSFRLLVLACEHMRFQKH